MIYHDENLLVIELAAQRFKALMQVPENVGLHKRVRDNLAEIKAQAPCLRLREDAYSSGSLWQKVVWWHDNLWSDETTWTITSATILNGMNGMQFCDALLPDSYKDDWVRCITHLANEIHGPDLHQYPAYAFLFSIPLAMLARWTRRRALYLPMNGLQRLLVGAWMYCGDCREHRRTANLSTSNNVARLP
ncbi:hypothetical protein BD311DRAFT_764114 [Dichomitus squalens]|uniref:Uncharacterized protein n=1 Tax=Dichomitus squalens TaxID=114155 RepID=A0A4Q9MI98_9APHY|nr:hypothetical protein BD311DRAFT_764114 [Dichomitus squalens]